MCDYLSKNKKLRDTIANNCCLISEYPPGTTPNNAFFRARNRIAAGLSVGVAVVEAPLKSGTRLFANEAADQGKELFAVPGNADAINCVGTNALLKEGAKPVTDGWEVMCEFEALYPNRISHTRDMTMPEEPKKEDKKPEKETKKVVDKRESTAYIDLQTVLEKLSESQIKIVSVMFKYTSIPEDTVAHSRIDGQPVALSDIQIKVSDTVATPAVLRMVIIQTRLGIPCRIPHISIAYRLTLQGGI